MPSFRSKVKKTNVAQGKSTLVYNNSKRQENKSKIKHHKRLINQQIFQCENCKIKFSREYNLQQHMAVHKGDKLIECDVCMGKFIPSYLRRHKVIHKNKEALKCKICKKSFTQKACLMRHMMIHTGLKPFKCEICNTGFTRKHFLTLHMTVHTGRKEFRCNKCKAAFARKMTLQQHMMKMHEKQKKKNTTNMNNIKDLIEKCEKCNKTFERSSLLRQHMKIHTIKNTYQCDDCEITFAHITSLEEHMKCHLAKEYFQCSICKSVFLTKISLIKHIRIHRRGKSLKKNNKKTITRTEKQLNNRKMSGKQNEKMKEKGGRNEKMNNKLNKKDSKRVVNKGNNEKKKSELNNKKKIENETNNVLNKCEICDKIFERRSLLRQHTKSHNVISTYQCDECLLQFTDKNLLEEHCKQHILIDYFQCNECKFVYDRKSSLIQHIKSHNKEKMKKGNREIRENGFHGSVISNDVHAPENEIITTPEIYRPVNAPSTPSSMILTVINASSYTIIRQNQNNQNENVMIICNPVNYATTQTNQSTTPKVLLMCNPSTSFTMIHRVPESQPTLTEIHDDPPQHQPDSNAQQDTKPTHCTLEDPPHLVPTVSSSFNSEPNICSSITPQSPFPSTSSATKLQMSPENVPSTSMNNMEFQPSVDDKSTQYCENLNEKPVQVCDVSTCSDNLDNYACDLCKIGFSTKISLTKHVEAHSEGIFYECDGCGDIFHNKKLLIKHTKGTSRNNTCRKYHKCDICSATFSKKGFLQHHVRMIHAANENRLHKTLRKYKCVYCPSVFNDIKHFRNHILSHKQKSYCVYCSASYNSKQQLINHFKVAHFQKLID